jgi:acyl-CoA dehydrogenase
VSFDLSLTPAHHDLIARTHRFAEEVVRPAAARYDREQEFPWEVIEAAAKEGFYNPLFYRDLIGDPTGLSLPLFMEELFWGCAGIGLAIVMPGLALSAMAQAATPEQLLRWAPECFGEPGDIKLAALAISEPEGGSDVRNLRTRARRDGDEWVVDGHKWFTSGAVGADLAIAMVVTDPDAPPYARASMICVPTDTPGFNLVRPISVMGSDKGPGHCEIRYEECRVPKENLLGERGAGFAIAQNRLGPGRIHHCMRAIGTAERAQEMMCRRANERVAFGGPLADKQFVQESIAASRMEIDQARLLTLYAAWKMDTEGKRAARQSISAIKVVAANMVMDVLDRAIQIHGSLGMTDDTPIGPLWRFSRMLRLADGPDEVHKMVLARRELNRWSKRDEAAASGTLESKHAPRMV